MGAQAYQRGTARRRVWQALALALLGVALFGASARAGVLTQRERPHVRSVRLSLAERRAITIQSVSVAGDDSVGVVIRAAFQGDIARYLGHGQLAHGLLALVLVPQPGGTPAAVLDWGGKRVVPITPARPAGAVGRGDQVTFYVGGAHLGRFARVELRAFEAVPPRASWRQILATRPDERIVLSPDASRLTCSELTSLTRQLRGLRARGLAVELSRLGAASTVACAPPPPPPPPTPPPPPPTTTTTPTPTPTPPCPTTAPAGAPPSPPAPSPTGVSVVQTDSALAQQMAPQPDLSFSSTPPAGGPVIAVNEQSFYQRFSGLGAALTDSAAWLICNQLSSADRATLMQELFGAGGIHLNFLRVAMGASGAMIAQPPYYTYDDTSQPDPSLASFSIGHDLSYIVPAVQQALSVNPGLQILANPWSPPAWMKGNDSLGNTNDSGTLNASDEDALAQYFVKFIQQYAAQGIPIAALTPQNEPRTPPGAGTSYPGLTLPASQESEFIAFHLVPALRAAGLNPKIYGNDLSWDQTTYVNSLTSGSAANYLAGIAWHCYFGTPTAMSQLHQSTPGLDQIVDECSPEIRGFGTPEFLISSLRNWASTVSVWTAATDPSGGPIQPGNNCGGCRGLVTIDENAHTATLRTEYYQLGQVSAFVQPGAVRIDSPNFVTYGVNGSNIETVTSGLDNVAFLNPDGSKVLVAYNNSTAPISFAVQSDGRYFTYTIPAQAMTTFVWR